MAGDAAPERGRPGNVDEVVRYYHKTESRWGYEFFLGGTKHFGYYEPGDRAWPFGKPLRRMEDKLAETLRLAPGSAVLDAGCGAGAVAERLAGVHGLNVTAIDVLDFNLRAARTRIRRRALDRHVNVLMMDYTRLGFADASFDGVYTMETLVHAAQPQTVLGEFHRVMRTGARLVMFEYARDPERAMSARAAWAFRTVNEVAAMPAFQVFDHGVLERMIASAGFSNVTVDDVTGHMLPMLKVFAATGFIPYGLGALTRQHARVVNAMSAVEFWRYRRHFRYNIYTAVK
jgi:ubiquinone/menaquinone biosynthesis C-methylase UbiE